MGDVQDYIAVGRTWRNLRKPSWLTTRLRPILFQSLRRRSYLHIGKLKSVRSSRWGRMSWWKRWTLFTRITL